MAQAKTLSAQEQRRVLDHIATRPHAARNRAIFMCSFAGAMRVGEIAALRICDVVDGKGNVLNEIRLSAEQTKGKTGRIVYVNEKLRKELAAYLKTFNPAFDDRKLFYTQKRMKDGFTANTLAQHFYTLYKNCGMKGVSSHSGRRTAATNIAQAGVSLKVLMKILGHKHSSTTLLYTEANPDMLHRAVEFA